MAPIGIAIIGSGIFVKDQHLVSPANPLCPNATMPPQFL